MSAGSNGGGMPPDHDDDPFAYLYRPEGGQAAGGQSTPPPRPPSSYHQVRPVGERTYGGQNRSPAVGSTQARQPQPDAYYAAPETQPGGAPPHGGPADRRRHSVEPRRNGLLIGAIAVVLAVVVGVGAAILFSGGDTEDTAGDDPGATTDTSGGESGGDNGDDPDPSGEESTPADPDALPAADVASLTLSGGPYAESTVTGARSSDGSYLAGLNASGASVTWSFDFQGEPGQYYFYTGYSTISDGQSIGFSVNGEQRDDSIDAQDYNPASDAWEESWFSTWNLVDVTQGQNTIQLTCGGSCDVLVDQLYLSDHELSDEELNAQEL
ncbi:carbohydrate-binding protein [Streptomyces sp. B6B3]|uniref:carbohydrate-binding protein n=1 Tax=Streptomyces sp. B6B3 TaxID=3153570 RepID=UPI00325DB336